MTISTLIGIVSAVLFFRAAQYERMSPWLWAIASVALSFVVSFVSPSVLLALVAQVGLFLVMWWYNAQRPPRP